MTELEHQIMDLASRWWRHAGSMDEAIRTETGLRPTRYYQLLHGLLARQDVEEAYPQLVHRVRRRATTAPRRALAMRLDR